MIAALIAQHERLLAANREATRLLKTAYALQLAEPLETAPVAWETARAIQEQRSGVRLWKYFMPCSDNYGGCDGA